jgi:peptidoglycan/LPS O-acetylase OafA/YrhL
VTATLERQAVWQRGRASRIPALDSLRGVAILSVFMYHAFFWSGVRVDSAFAGAVARLTRPGWLGVDLFFVLSGFLITGRLLDRREAAAGDYYRSFYARRAVRILPLYFATLAVIGSILWWAAATSAGFIVASVFFLPNLAIIAGFWTSAPLAVLWSLGIEEQVYLIWPFLVRAVTARNLARVFMAIAIVEPVLRYATFTAGVLQEEVSIATWLRLDGFAWGGLLALAVRDGRLTLARLAGFGGGAMLVSVGTAAACLASGSFSRRSGVGSAAQFACADLFFAGLVAAALCRTPGDTRRPLLAQFGRISYCLYLVHQFAFWMFDRLSGVEPPLTLGPLALRAAIVLAVSTAMAELSWRYLEGPALERQPSMGDLTVVKTA